jgi:hypothetical protein
LVAGLARIDDQVTAGRDIGSERDAGKDRAIFEREQSRPEVADPRIDDRARPW